MQTRLIKRWVEVGSPSLEDLGAAINIGYVNLIKVFNGTRYPDTGTRELLAEILGKKPEDLFD